MLRSIKSGKYICGTPAHCSFVAMSKARIFSSAGRTSAFLTSLQTYRKYRTEFDELEIQEFELTTFTIKQPHELISDKKLINLLKK